MITDAEIDAFYQGLDYDGRIELQTLTNRLFRELFPLPHGADESSIYRECAHQAITILAQRVKTLGEILE